MKKLALIAGSLMALSIAAPAYAHVTVQPNEAVAGSFSRFVVRVPTERDVPTLTVTLKLPPLAFLAFEDKTGWTRTEKVTKFDEPLEAFGQEITRGVTSVTWTGGEIGPEEFAEFGFSAALPEDEGQLVFPATQVYEGGETVKWSGPPDAEAPAARVSIIPLPLEEGQGQLSLLADLNDRVEQVETEAAAPETEETTEPDTESASDEAEDDDDDSSLGVILGAAGLALGLIALIVALTRGRKTA
jgi:periplasmic copper chaperone A